MVPGGSRGWAEHSLENCTKKYRRLSHLPPQEEALAVVEQIKACGTQAAALPLDTADIQEQNSFINRAYAGIERRLQHGSARFSGQLEPPVQRIRLRTPGDFAGQLNVHINHLDKALKETTVKTTSRILADRLTLKARAMLKHTHPLEYFGNRLVPGV